VSPQLNGRSGRWANWAEAFQIYLNGRVIVMLFLGFSAGLPFLLIFATLSTWMREEDVTRTAIGFFSWVGIMFSIKVFWAPVVDRIALPFLTSALGRRRSWMLLAQLGIIGGLVGIAGTDPGMDLVQVALFALLVAFSSATQDISIDAYRIEAVERDLQGAMAATYQLGYRIAMLVAGAGALYIAEFFSWSTAYLVMAACVLVGFITVLIIDEPTRPRDQAAEERERRLAQSLAGGLAIGGRARQAFAWFSGAVISPFADFFGRMGWLAVVILAFIGVYRLSDITMGIMANPFYIDLGFTKTEIANVTKLYGVIMSGVGALAGGVLVVRYGIMKPLLLGAILVASTNLLFALLALAGNDLVYLAMTISADNFSGGLAGAAFIAYLSSLTNTAYTATQYALFSSMFTLPGKFLGGFSGIMVDAAGYVNFFIYAAALGIPAILLTVYLMRNGTHNTAAPTSH